MVERAPTPEFSPDEDQLIDRVATSIVDRGLTAPAILFLESVGPMNFLASQAMLFFGPMAQLVLPHRDYDTLQGLLERRVSIERILERIEALDAAKRKGKTS